MWETISVIVGWVRYQGLITLADGHSMGWDGAANRLGGVGTFHVWEARDVGRAVAMGHKAVL